MKRYAAMEAEKTKATAALKDCSLKIKGLIDDEERFIKNNREARQLIDKEKSVLGAKLQLIQREFDALESALPRVIHVAVSEREVEVTRIEYEIRDHKRELQSRQFDLTKAKEKGARLVDLHEPQAEITRLEEAVEGLESDLKEAKASLEAAVILKREALESAAEKVPAG